MRGRKPLFKKYMIEEAEKLAEMGLTNEEIADFWGRSRRAFQYWLKKYPELLHTLKIAKDRADKKVEKSLYQRALGYQYKEKTFEKRAGRLILTREVIKDTAPSTTAQIFWLKNRRPDLWKDVQEQRLSGTIRASLSITDLKESIKDYENGNDK